MGEERIFAGMGGTERLFLKIIIGLRHQPARFIQKSQRAQTKFGHDRCQPIPFFEGVPKGLFDFKVEKSAVADLFEGAKDGVKIGGPNSGRVCMAIRE